MRTLASAPLALLIAVAVALALSGCGGGTTKTTVVTHTVTQGTSTKTTTQPKGSSGTSSQTRTGTTPSEPPTRIIRLTAFKSPTGNIGCMMIGGVARCDIAKRSWSARRPSGCPSDMDFGQGLEVARTGRATVVCAGDTARDPTAPKLRYGTGSQVGDFICVSRPTGMTCTNRFNGHGFLINSERYQLF